MGRKLKKKSDKEITIKSDETKIVFGILLTILSIGFTISPFVDAVLFRYIVKFLGYTSVPIGLSLTYISIGMYTNIKFFKSIKTVLGLIIFSIAFSTFLTFWIPDEILVSNYDYSLYGGLFGYHIHLQLLIFMGRFLELLLLIFLFILSISLLTNVKLAQIRDFIRDIFGNTSVDPDLQGEDIEITNHLGEGEQKVKLKGDSQLDIFSNEAKPEDIVMKKYTAESHTQDSKVVKVSALEPTEEQKYPNWQFPSTDLLQEPTYTPQDEKVYKKNALVIEHTLKSFGLVCKVAEISVGPTVVQYALSINIGTKVSKVNNLADDLALALSVASSSIRIETPIPGTSYIGIETPNPIKNYVFAKEMVNHLKKQTDLILPLLLGKDVAGKYITADLTKMPHLLVAGATGTGKSVGINSILLGLLMTKTPDEVKFLLVDPKMVEMAPYNGIPYLMNPVITDMDLVLNALEWAVQEMQRRYLLLKQAGVRNIKEYNAMMGYHAMHYIVIVVDEMADLMFSKGAERGADVEMKIVRLAQMARAIGIHLILATQRPSVNVITGLIKANVPARVAFQVATAIDSRVIIDQIGAETLLGNGDMLFKNPTLTKPIRIQGAFTDIKDLDKVISHIKGQAGEFEYSKEIVETRPEPSEKEKMKASESSSEIRKALEIIIMGRRASTSYLQRKMGIGYNKAATLIEEMEELGAISPPEGGGSVRRILVSSPDQVLGGEDN